MAVSSNLDVESLMRAITCPVTLQIMERPVVLSPCGHSVDQTTAELFHGALRNGLCEQRANCALCRKEVTSYVPSHALRDVIQRIVGISPESIMAFPSEPLVVEERKGVVTAEDLPFPGQAARFAHASGNWQYHNSGGPLCYQMAFKSVTDGSLFTEFSLLGYQNGNISICIIADRDRLDLVKDYFQRFDITVDEHFDVIGMVMSCNPEQTRKMFAILARHNEIPTTHFQRIKEIVERGHCE